VSTLDVILFVVVDLTVIICVKMVCNAWVAATAAKRSSLYEIQEYVKSMREEENGL
jgi:hypothetical protein